MRLPSGEFVWGLGDNSQRDFTVQLFKAFARRMYRSYMGHLADTNVFDKELQDAIIEMQDRLVASGRLVPGKFTRGVLDLETEYASGFKIRPAPGPECVGFTIGGAGSAWNNGYQWDLGEALDKRRCFHQPIGYDTNPFPMSRGTKTGVDQLIFQLDLARPQFGGRNCTTIPWFVPLAYSMGSNVWMIVLMRILHGDLQRFKSTYMGSNSFGNPMRQKEHGLPGGILVEGEGIACNSTIHDVPDCHWDFTAEKGMVGSPGNDLYARVDGSAITVKDMRAVWDMVNTGNPLSLTEAVLMLLAHPTFDGGYGAAVAALNALDFFIVKRLTPHTSYQFVQPIAGDPRDCWRIALDHSADIVANLPRPFK